MRTGARAARDCATSALAKIAIATTSRPWIVLVSNENPNVRPRRREQLTREWANFPAADRSLCVQTASMGGMASYVALITCLEMKRDVVQRSSGMNTQPSSLPAKKK